MKSIKFKIKKWQTKLKNIQDSCPHKSNTGNYDPTSDCYWIEYFCYDCEKS